MKLYTDEEYKSKQHKNKLPLKCDYCNTEFLRLKRDIATNERVGIFTHYCNNKCSHAVRITRKNFSCVNCGKIISRTPAHALDKVFCSKRCSALINNTLRPTRLKKKCKLCGSLIPSNNTFCTDCYHTKGKFRVHGKDINNISLKEYLKTRKNDASRYNDIRNKARKAIQHLPQKCSKCGYSKHVQAAHVKPISKFPLHTKISTINSVSNIILLCPNCHWEYDHHIKTQRSLDA